MADVVEDVVNATVKNATIFELTPAELIAKFQKAGAEVENGLVLAYVALLFMAIIPIWFGSKASVTSDEEKAKKKAAGEEVEIMTSKDAMMFPLFASCALFGLYTVFQLFGKEYINLLLGGYFFLLGVISMTTAIRPFGDLVCPASWKEEPFSILIKKEGPKDAKVQTEEEKEAAKKAIKPESEMTWPEWLNVQFFGPEVLPAGPEGETMLDAKIDNIDLFCLAVAGAVGVWYLFTKHWVANNCFGLSFAFNGISVFTLGSFRTGCILLSGLFLYDIFWVFGTDVMVTVATSFDAPIKVIFPKDFMENGLGATKHAMLGLGDIVLPGVVIALLLRFDVKSKRSSTPYFIATYIAYIVGLVATIVIMHTFQAAQPALLYLVPACLLTPIALSVVRSETKALFEYDEEEETVENKKEK